MEDCIVGYHGYKIVFPGNYLSCRRGTSSSFPIRLLLATRILSSKPPELVWQRKLPRNASQDTGKPRLPMGAAGLTGFATYSVLQRVLSTAQAATYSRPSMDTSQMIRQVQNMMPGMGTQTGNQGPLNLPGDMTRAQFLILTKYQQGFAKPKDIAKHLSMDKRQVEKETNALKSNGYLSEKNKLTSKGLETLS